LHLGRLVLLAAWTLSAACGSATVGDLTTPPAPAAGPGPAAAPERPPAETYSNRVRWKTASELNNFGYDVYRGESPDGPFERLNPEVIVGAGTTDEPTAYEFVDRTVDPHKTYYYYVESVSMNGVRERFTPIGKALPKIADAGEAVDGPTPEVEGPEVEGPDRPDSG
jgi:hypothetical protein